MAKNSIPADLKKTIKLVVEELGQTMESKPDKNFVKDVTSSISLIFNTAITNDPKALTKPDFTHWKIGCSRMPIVTNINFFAAWKISRNIGVAVVNWFIQKGMDEITPKDIQIQNDIYITLQLKGNIH
jgi:hypothetical protein